MSQSASQTSKELFSIISLGIIEKLIQCLKDKVSLSRITPVKQVKVQDSFATKISLG